MSKKKPKQPKINDEKINEIALDTVLDVFHFVTDKENYMILNSMPGTVEYIADYVGINDINNLQKMLKQLKQNELILYDNATKTYRITEMSKNIIRLIEIVTDTAKTNLKSILKEGELNA